MAIITSTPSDKTLSMNKNNTSGSTTISWTSPTVPSDATITSCVLTGTATPSATVTGITIGGTSISTSGGSFSVNLGTSITSSASVSATKSRGTATTINFTDMTYTVTYEVPKTTYTVTFKDWDGTTLNTQTVEEGSAATAPSNPTRDGYNFIGWDKAFSNVTSNLTITAQYEAIIVDPEPTVPGSATLRPINATQDSGYNNKWTNIANTYDTDTSTNGTLVVTGTSQSGFVRKYVDTIFNFDTSSIPASATITSATLTVRCKSSATTNLYLTVNVNGDDAKKVIDNELMASTSTKDYTGDITNYVKDLNYLNLNLTTAGSSNRTFTCYDIRIDVEYETSGNETYHTVTFKDWDGSVLKTESVLEGNSATAPSNPSREGYTFSGWDKSFTNVSSDLTVTAQYIALSYTVTFKDWNGTVLKTETVNYGNSATAPSNPTRDGYIFTGWDCSFTNITADLIVTAVYKEKSESATIPLYFGDYNVENIYMGDATVEGIYLGEHLIYGV